MDVKLPKLGEGAESGTVVSVMTKVGDSLAKGQTILELENEKAVAPIPSPDSGRVVSIRVKEGDKLTVGQVILTLAEGTETSSQSASAKAPSPRPQPAPPPPEQTPVSQKEPAEDSPPVTNSVAPAASPSLRKIARELGIELTRVRGSERGGRIVLADVRAYIERLQQLAFAPKKAPVFGPSLPEPESIDFSQWGPITTKPITSLRRIISQRMLESWTTIPHVTQFDDADITTLEELRKQFAPAYETKGARLTLTTFVLRAVVAVLQRHPLLNSSFDAATEQLISKNYYHLGLAVDTEQGLIVPVIRDVNKKGPLELSKEIAALAAKARDRKLALNELKGGTFTISNQGGIGGAHFTPIINKPQVAILGLGRGRLKPVVRDGKIEPRLMLPLALSYDHRVIDGGAAARFIVDLVRELESAIAWAGLGE